MFDSRNTQLADNYQQFVESLIHNFIKIGSVIEELIKAIQEKAQENKEKSPEENAVQDKEKLSDIDVQIGSEKYRLVPDEELPGAWKWESAEMTDFQEQTVLRRLITEPAINPEIQTDITDVERDLSLSVVAHTESGESVVAYHQDSKGICHTNIITTNLSSEEILDIINQIITSPEIENDNKELELIADELLTQIVSEITSSRKVVAFNEPLSQSSFEEETVIFLDEDEPIPEPPIENYLPDPWEEEEVDWTESKLENNSPGSDFSTHTQSIETEDIPHKKRSSQESQDATDKPKQKTAANYSYEQINNSDEVSSETKRWVREVEVPVSKAVANSRAERSRIKEENIKIAQTVVEILKAYGEETIHGYEAYKSDAFVIKLEGSKYSIHHRRDELYCFGNPLIQFSLDSKGNPKIDIPPTQMLPVERQEFLMVGERLESGKELPQLAIADLRDIANNLGSLAPAGTFKSLESFRETEMLGLLNSALQKANTDTLNVGEYTLTRTRDVEAGLANLSLYKTAESGERRELLSFTLQKTEAGLVKHVNKFNINEQDLTQLKLISQNAKAFERTFQKSSGQHEESISEIKVKLHPAIQKAWKQIESQGNSWHSNIKNADEYPTIYQFNYSSKKHSCFIERLAIALSKLPTASNSHDLNASASDDENLLNLQKFFKGKINTTEYLATVR